MNLRLRDLAPALALRPAGPADVLPLARLWRDAWSTANPSVLRVEPLAHWEQRVDAEFGPPCTALVVARSDGALQAFMVVDLACNHLHQLFVAPAAQSNGLGAAMVREVCECLCPGGWTLHVATTNQRARRFYAACGLVEDSVDRHPQTGRERVLCRWTPPGVR